jgi:hypothetical protein
VESVSEQVKSGVPALEEIEASWKSLKDDGSRFAEAFAPLWCELGESGLAQRIVSPTCKRIVEIHSDTSEALVKSIVSAFTIGLLIGLEIANKGARHSMEPRLIQ